MLQPIEPAKDASSFPFRHSRDLAGPWHASAACRRDEAGMFFAPSKEPTAARLSREEAAKRVCARCPVMLECREHALLQPEPYGVWGGLTAAERRVVLARRRRQSPRGRLRWLLAKVAPYHKFDIVGSTRMRSLHEAV